MGGKTGTTTQSVQIPPEVLARYNAVNARAETTSQQPFQQYSSSPEAFVAQLNPQQQAGISNINQSAMAAQPAYEAAMSGTSGTYGALTPEGFQQGVQGYMSPFLQNALGATAAQMQNVNQQQQNQLTGNAISAGAFGGDRAGIARANLINQQNLAMGQTLGQMAQQGYQGAAQNYLTAAGQRGALAAQMGQLGAGAQQAGLQGAQAQIGAGTLGQQTEQAGKTALYNQFQQQQAYPFQVAQFLANIAEGTGALSGSTTTTTQPMPFFSDRRLKEDVKQIGKAYNGLPIYTFKYKGDPKEQTHIGFMADEVEKKHPEAVGIAAGYKTVDYDRATKAHGGLISEGGAVHPEHEGMGFAMGGMPYGGGGIGYVPEVGQQANNKLMTAGPAPDLPESGLAQIGDVAKTGIGLYKDYDWLKSKGFASGGSPYDDTNQDDKKLDIPDKPDTHQLAVAGAPPSQGGGGMSDLANIAKFAMMFMKDGGRAGYKPGGDVEEQPDITPDYVRDIAAKSAANAGINPTRALSIGQLESGFNHNAVGDEGSSFGPWQMHYGNMSQKYPHGGLGDVFTKETGYDLRDPAVRNDPKAIQANADWVTNYMKQHGDSAWSTSRQLDKQGSSLADMPAAGAHEAQAAPNFGVGKPDSTDILLSVLSGLGSMAESKSPFLGGALLAGIGGGAKTYANLRAQQSEIALRQSEAMKNTMGLMATRFSPMPNGKFFDSWNNRVVTGEERAQAAVDMGLPPSFVGMGGGEGAAGGFNVPSAQGEPAAAPAGGIAPAAAPAPAGGIAAAAPAPAPAGGIAPAAPATPAGPAPEGTDTGNAAEGIYAKINQHPDVVKYNTLADQQMADADRLAKKAEEWASVPTAQGASLAASYRGDSQVLREQAMANRNLAMKTREQLAALPIAEEAEKAKYKGQTQTVFDEDGNQVVTTGDKAYDIAKNGEGVINGKTVYSAPPQSAYLNENVKNYGEFAKKAIEFETAYKTDRRALDSLAHVLQNWQAGRGANVTGELEGLAEYYGVPLPEGWKGSATGLDVVTKLATGIGISASKNMAAGAPASNLRETMETAPEAFRTPDALYKNLTDRMGAMDLTHKMYTDWSDQGQPKNIPDYVNKWSKENKANIFYDPLAEKVAPFKGSTAEGKKIIGAQKPQAQPPAAYPNARQGNDGKFYIPDPNRPGKYMMVQ